MVLWRRPDGGAREAKQLLLGERISDHYRDHYALDDHSLKSEKMRNVDALG